MSDISWHPVKYDAVWPAQFEVIAGQLGQALDGQFIGIEHVGSTSVPGLVAKPIIDVNIVISSRFMLPEVITRLAALGYLHKGDKGVPGREAFAWSSGPPRRHLYVSAVDTPNLHMQLLFRDYLQLHPEAAKAYGELKLKLTRSHPHDREAYTEAKTDFIQGVLRRAQTAL